MALGFGPVSRNRLSIPKEEVVIAEQWAPSGNLERQQIRKKRATCKSIYQLPQGEIIDQVWDARRQGFDNYLVEIGGEIRARGNGKSGIGWTVGLEDGPRNQAEDWTAVDLLDYSVATSGTYRQSKPNPNSAFPASHLLDPRTGRPVEHNLVAVNVLAPTARDADALATAL